MTLRAQFDPGAQRLPGAMGKLKEAARNPWQVTVPAVFPEGPGMQDVPEVRDEQGLFVKTLRMAPGTSVLAPSASGGNGQYVIAVKGGLVHEGKEREALTVVFNKPQEAAYRIQAGPQGLEALILNFPRVGQRAAEVQAPAAGLRKWQCVLCAFFYDEALGIPEEGIPAGTRWADVPESWSCPDCGARKADFEMVEV
jgi:rubredoxin